MRTDIHTYRLQTRVLYLLEILKIQYSVSSITGVFRLSSITGISSNTVSFSPVSSIQYSVLAITYDVRRWSLNTLARAPAPTDGGRRRPVRVPCAKNCRSAVHVPCTKSRHAAGAVVWRAGQDIYFLKSYCLKVGIELKYPKNAFLLTPVILEYILQYPVKSNTCFLQSPVSSIQYLLDFGAKTPVSSIQYQVSIKPCYRQTDN